MFTTADVEAAISQCNFTRAIGEDGFDGRILDQS